MGEDTMSKINNSKIGKYIETNECKSIKPFCFLFLKGKRELNCIKVCAGQIPTSRSDAEGT